MRKVDNPECKVISLIVDADTERWCGYVASLDICACFPVFSYVFRLFLCFSLFSNVFLCFPLILSSFLVAKKVYKSFSGAPAREARAAEHHG